MLGISHKTAPVALRERLALTEHEIGASLRELVSSSDEVHEAVAISTCNRTEIYTVVGDPVQAETELLSRIARRAHIRPTELAEAIYSPRNCDAARQLFRVTAGLESMIVGEAEIQGQVKRSYDLALEAGTTGPLTNRLFTAALQTGKRVRSETRIGASRVSVSSVAVALAHEIVGPLTDRDVVIIGAGKTSELTARALADEGVRTIFVANRHADRARAMAEHFGGQAAPLDDLPALLEKADIVVSSTSSEHAILGTEELEVVMRARDSRPIVLIDIAVPRDIEPTCAELPGVTLYDIDDLQAVVARNMSVRKGEAATRRGDRRGRDPALRALDGPARRRADDRRAARARRPARRAGAGRERRPLGVRLAARRRARGRDRARGHAAPAARADDPPEVDGPRRQPRPARAPARAVRAGRRPRRQREDNVRSIDERRRPA